MSVIFFDIETLSLEGRISFYDIVIAIAYKVDGSPVEVLKEWEIGEYAVLENFLNLIASRNRTVLIGHNILRFDIPLLACRAAYHGLGSFEELIEILFGAYTIDTIQAMLPRNGFSFWGLRLEDCARKYGFDCISRRGWEIEDLYISRDYDAITTHVIEDVNAVVALYLGLSNDSYLTK